MNKESVLITPNVIEECLCESFDIFEKKAPLRSRTHENMETAS